jgi:hypothetical protein
MRDYFGKCICNALSCLQGAYVYVFFLLLLRKLRTCMLAHPHPFWGKKYLCSVRALVSSDSHRETTRKYYKSFPASSTLLSFFYRICSRWHQRCLVGYSCCCPHTTQHFLWAVAAPFPACQARQRCQLAACSGKSDPSHCDRNSKLRAFVSELTMWVVVGTVRGRDQLWAIV